MGPEDPDSVPVSVPVLLESEPVPVLVSAAPVEPVELVDSEPVEVETPVEVVEVVELVVASAVVLEPLVSGSGGTSVGVFVMTPSVSSGQAQLLGLGLSQRR
jgi:hypothetical protein